MSTKEAVAAKYSVKDVAEAVGLQEASVRVGLRDSDFKREGRSWGWNTKKDFDEVVSFFKGRSDRRPDVTPKKADAKAETKKADAKPAKKETKAPAKKVARK